ncbi:MAG: MacB-like periplasmic core domain protein [Gemmatimonadetes bacterium]|jgi:lipoprotein-releasing system permease protein|nr:MacB-like periplasmic core domain protein [Gemmatimonadota bacterium]
MSKLEMAIAWRYLRSRRGSKLLSLISVIAIGGVVIGVSALIVIMGVMTGLQNDLRDKILIGSPDVRVLNYGSDMVIKDWKPLLAKVLAEPGVDAAAPFVLTKALVGAGHKYNDGAYVMGIIPEGEGGPPVTTIRSYRTSGDFRFHTLDGKQQGAVIGAKLANKLQVYPGVDSVTLTTVGAEVSAVTGTPVPREIRLEVTGVFDTGMYEYDNGYIFVSLPVAQRLADLGQDVTGLEVRTKDRFVAPGVAQSLAKKLGYPYRTEDWQAQNSSLFSALRLEKLGMTFILLLIILVAAFNIVGTLTMVVADKTKEIGILRAMGMPAASIRRIFLVQGTLIGVVGTALGLMVGLLTAIALDSYKLIKLDPQVYFIDHLPVARSALDIGVTVAASLLIAAVATVYPAIQASRLFPVEAMRE